MCFKITTKFLFVFSLKTGAIVVSCFSYCLSLFIIGILVTSNQPHIDPLVREMAQTWLLLLSVGVAVSSLLILVAIDGREMPGLLFCGTGTYILTTLGLAICASLLALPLLYVCTVGSIMCVLCVVALVSMLLYFCAIVESFYMDLAT